MSDLINREEAIKQYCREMCGEEPCDGCDGIHILENLPTAYDKEETIQKKQDWIPFKFEYDAESGREILCCPLPEDEEEILVSNGQWVGTDIFLADGSECYLDNGRDFEGLAWQPLPEPWKGE